jgi:heme/copper-type cytochrome/quinol oxidase subunit 2
MERLDRIVSRMALPLLILTLIGVPAGVFGYDRYLQNQYPDDAKVFTIYFDGTRNWTETRISGLTTFTDPPDLQEIRVRKGDLVVLRLMAADVHHGFALPDFGLGPIEIAPGQLHEVRFRADKVGEFLMFCTVVCGPAHKDMQAKVVVTG